MSLKKHTQDSLIMVAQNQLALQKAKALMLQRRKKKEQFIQNWHVIDGKIGDPILD